MFIQITNSLSKSVTENKTVFCTSNFTSKLLPGCLFSQVNKDLSKSEFSIKHGSFSGKLGTGSPSSLFEDCKRGSDR